MHWKVFLLDLFHPPRPDPALASWFQAAASEWQDTVLPAYSGGSIANLPASVLSAFGVSPGGSRELLPPVSADRLPPELLNARVVLLVVIDGLGAHNLMDGVGRGDVTWLLTAGHQSTLTSVFPPTTAAATTSLQYGLGPATHGMAGYTLYLPDIKQVFNMITWRPAGSSKTVRNAPRPEAFIQQPNIFGYLDRSGIDTVIVSNMWFETSPLTRAQASGVRYRGYKTLADFSYRLLREVERPGRRFVFGYWDGFDALGHSWGSDASVAQLELRLIDQALQEGFLQPLESMHEDVAVIVTADHGHTAMPRDNRWDLGEIPGLIRSLAHRPTGEPRQLGLTTRPGREIDRDSLTGMFGSDIAVLDGGSAIEAGLYGPLPHHQELQTRTGDTLLLARGPGAFTFPNGSTGSVGGHGSLTPREMLVPLLVWRYTRT